MTRQEPMFITPGPLFGWETTEAAKVTPPEPPVPESPAPRPPAADSPSRGKRGFEQFLRDLGLPYVAVDEAKKAIFADAKIGSFHFLVYMADGPNHLVTVIAGRPTPPQRECLAEWEKVFGTAFRGIFVRRCHGGPWEFTYCGPRDNETCETTWSEYRPLTAADEAAGGAQ